MKKLTLLAAAIFLFAFTAKAQLYIRAQVGYAIPTSTEPFDINDVTQTSSSYTETAVYTTTGGGFVPGVTVGYFFNSCLGVELSGQYLMGSKTTAEQSYPNGAKVALTRYTEQFRVIPSLVVRCNNDGIKPYAKFGVLIPLGGKTTTEAEQPEETPAGMAQGMYQIETNGQFTIGFASGVGLEFPISDRINIFGELALQSLSITAERSEIVSASVGGTDILPTLPVYGKMTNYVSELNNSSNNFGLNPASSLDSPIDEIAPRSQYGSIGLNIGVTINL